MTSVGFIISVLTIKVAHFTRVSDKTGCMFHIPRVKSATRGLRNLEVAAFTRISMLLITFMGHYNIHHAYADSGYNHLDILYS